MILDTTIKNTGAEVNVVEPITEEEINKKF